MKFIAMLIPTLLLVSCGNEGGGFLGKPTVSLGDAKLQDVRATDATAVFNLKIDNPNSFGLTIKGITYGLAFNGHPSALNGKLDNGAEIPARGSATIAIPVTFKYTDVFLSVADIIRDKGANYTLQGVIDTGLFSVPYQTGGKLTY